MSYEYLALLHDHNKNSNRLNLIIMSHIRYMKDILNKNKCESLEDYNELLSSFYENIYECRETINKMTKKINRFVIRNF